MLNTSLKQKTDRLLRKGEFQKSKVSKGRIKGLPNVSAGYTFEKMWDDYYLYFTSGNMAFRGIPVEEKDQKTVEMYDYLKTTDVSDTIELTTLRDYKVIKLLHD